MRNGQKRMRGRGGGGGGGGGGAAYVMPGTYTVALTSNGKVLDSKPLKLVFDPDVKFAAGEHEKYNATIADLASLQARGNKVQAALNTLHPQMADVQSKLAASNAPASVKTQFEALNKDYENVRKKFGVPSNAGGAGGRGGAGGGGGRGGAPVDPDNVLAKTAQLRNAVSGVWETPSSTLSRQYSEVKVELPAAITAANGVLARANAMAATLKKYDIQFNPPATVK